MRDFEVVAVLRKNVERVLTKGEMELLVAMAKDGVKKAYHVGGGEKALEAELWHRTITAEDTPRAMRAVRKTVGQDAEIIYIELVKEDHLADAQV